MMATAAPNLHEAEDAPDTIANKMAAIIRMAALGVAILF
jgi:hypothetical protein